MRCDQMTPYLPGYAGDDLREETTRAVEAHLQSCDSCRAEAGRLRRVTSGLRTLQAREVEPPPFLVESILESVGDRKRRVIPLIPPTVPADLMRAVQDNREAIASVASGLVIAAGAAYALWRAVRGRPGSQPATSS